MKRKTVNMLMASCLFTASALAGAASNTVYDVVSRDKAPASEQYDATFWENIPAIEGGFHFPWEKKTAPKTVFRAFHDNDNLYFNFVVKDDDVVVAQPWQGESDVDNEDRVELYFAPSAIDQPAYTAKQDPKSLGKNPWLTMKLPYYYAAEIDPKGRVHDYRGVYYRNLDSDWQLKGLKTNAQINDDGYIVQGNIPLNSLKELNLIDENGMIRTGVFRAEFNRGKDDGVEQHWIAWIDPETILPDFHVEKAFGYFRLLPADTAAKSAQ